MEKKNCQWYDTWDIASGCIWAKDAFVNAELIAEKDTHSGLWKAINI